MTLEPAPKTSSLGLEPTKLYRPCCSPFLLVFWVERVAGWSAKVSEGQRREGRVSSSRWTDRWMDESRGHQRAANSLDRLEEEARGLPGVLLGDAPVRQNWVQVVRKSLLVDGEEVEGLRGRLLASLLRTLGLVRALDGPRLDLRFPPGGHRGHGGTNGKWGGTGRPQTARRAAHPGPWKGGQPPASEPTLSRDLHRCDACLPSIAFVVGWTQGVFHWLCLFLPSCKSGRKHLAPPKQVFRDSEMFRILLIPTPKARFPKADEAAPQGSLRLCSD